jgi:hypothetical protein
MTRLFSSQVVLFTSHLAISGIRFAGRTLMPKGVLLWRIHWKIQQGFFLRSRDALGSSESVLSREKVNICVAEVPEAISVLPWCVAVRNFLIFLRWDENRCKMFLTK